jgi:phosphinothricin acetyltransferase
MPIGKIAAIGQSDRTEVIDIFNYYVRNGFAAFPDSLVPYEFFDTLMALCRGYPSVAARDENGAVQGFGMLRPHSPMPVFSRTAEISCFIAPGMTGKGLGSLLVTHLLQEGGERGIATVLAGISSRNEGSIRFHQRLGFVECGRFREIGEKNGLLFDVVWMQKMM